jgi:hypothetical protein
MVCSTLENAWGSYLESLSRLRSDGLLVYEAGSSEFLGRHVVTLRYQDLFELGLWKAASKDH